MISSMSETAPDPDIIVIDDDDDNDDDVEDNNSSNKNQSKSMQSKSPSKNSTDKFPKKKSAEKSSSGPAATNSSTRSNLRNPYTDVYGFEKLSNPSRDKDNVKRSHPEKEKSNMLSSLYFTSTSTDDQKTSRPVKFGRESISSTSSEDETRINANTRKREIKKEALKKRSASTGSFSASQVDSISSQNKKSTNSMKRVKKSSNSDDHHLKSTGKSKKRKLAKKDGVGNESSGESTVSDSQPVANLSKRSNIRTKDTQNVINFSKMDEPNRNVPMFVSESYARADNASLNHNTLESLKSSFSLATSQEIIQILSACKDEISGCDSREKAKCKLALSLIMDYFRPNGEPSSYTRNDVNTLLQWSKSIDRNECGAQSLETGPKTVLFGKKRVSLGTKQFVKKDDILDTLSKDIREVLKSTKIKSCSDLLLYPSDKLSNLLAKSNLRFPGKSGENIFQNVKSFKVQIDQGSTGSHRTDSSYNQASVSSNSSLIGRNVNDQEVFALDENHVEVDDINLDKVLSTVETRFLNDINIYTVQQLFEVDVLTIVSALFQRWRQYERTFEFCYGVVYSWFLRSKETIMKPISEKIRQSKEQKKYEVTSELFFKQSLPEVHPPSLLSLLSSSESKFLSNIHINNVDDLLDSDSNHLSSKLAEHWGNPQSNEFCTGVINSWLVRAKEAKKKYEDNKANPGTLMLGSLMDKHMLQYLEEIGIYNVAEFLRADTHVLGERYRRWLNFYNLSHLLCDEKTANADIFNAVEEMKEVITKLVSLFTDSEVSQINDSFESSMTSHESAYAFISALEEKTSKLATPQRSSAKISLAAKSSSSKKKPVFQLKIDHPIPHDDDLEWMQNVSKACYTIVDESTRLPTRFMTVYTSSDDYLFDFEITIEQSNIPNSGYGAFITYKGARKLKSNRVSDIWCDPADTRNEMQAILPNGNGIQVKVNGQGIHEDSFGSGEIGHFLQYNRDDYIPCNVDFCTYFQGCGLIDIGRYSPFLPTDRKINPIFVVKNFLFSYEPSCWLFHVPETLNGHQQVVDFTDDSTGLPHVVARSNIPMYVNEVGHDSHLKQNILPRDHNDRVVKYFFIQREPMKKGEKIELLGDYGVGYEAIRERKGYGKKNLTGELKSDLDEASRYERNFKERKELENFFRSYNEKDMKHLLEFLDKFIIKPLYSSLRKLEENDLNKGKESASWRQWVARRRLNWISDALSTQLETLKNRSASYRRALDNSNPSHEELSEAHGNAFRTGTIVYINGWDQSSIAAEFNGLGWVTDVSKEDNIYYYNILLEKQKMLYDVPEGVLTKPTEKDMEAASERWRKEKALENLPEMIRVMRTILDEMKWKKSLDKCIPIQFDYNCSPSDFELYNNMHREFSEEILYVLSMKRKLLFPYNVCFWCPISIRLLREVLHLTSAFQLSDQGEFSQIRLAQRIFDASDKTANEIRRVRNRESINTSFYDLIFKGSPTLKNKRNRAAGMHSNFFITLDNSSSVALQEDIQLKSAQADLQAYHDVLELFHVSVIPSLSIADLMGENEYVNIVITENPLQNSNEKEKYWAVPRDIKAVELGYAKIHEYWYLWHQLLYVVNSISSQVEWLVDDIEEVYSLEKLCNIVDIEFADSSFMPI